ncbi:MAG: PilZ domain-containing protein, partial [Rhodovibrionaceae bacterium]
ERPAYPAYDYYPSDPSSEQQDQLQEAYKSELTAYEGRMRGYALLIFWVTLPLGLAALALGALPRLGDIATGLIFGGVATLVAGQVDSAAYLPSYLKFLAVLAALLLLLFVAWRGSTWAGAVRAATFLAATDGIGKAAPAAQNRRSVGGEDDAMRDEESSGDAVADRRGAPRKRTLQKGELFYLNSGAAVECVVLDVSASGARLRPVDVLSCPGHFRLRGPDGALRACEVVWRNDSELGVRFL